MSDEEKAIIFGTLLGDTFCNRRASGNCRLKIEHGVQQKEYVMWLHTKLLRLCSNTQPPKITKARPKVPNGSVLFYTNTTPALNNIHALFYKYDVIKKKYVKTVTQELIDNLPMSPYVLATLFCDDGSKRNDCNAGKIATQGFTKSEQELLLLYLKKWGIDGKIVFSSIKKNQYYITLSADTFPNFKKIVEPIILNEIPSLAYKLNTKL